MDNSRLSNEQVDAVTNFRGNQWQGAINSVLQDLITQASELRADINASKTGTRKRYYQKKFAKIQKQIFQALIAKQQIDGKLTDDPDRFGFDEPTTETDENGTITHHIHDIYNPPQFS